eukprot:350682-Chlamydomonas_euryale.AAC.11
MLWGLRLWDSVACYAFDAVRSSLSMCRSEMHLRKNGRMAGVDGVGGWCGRVAGERVGTAGELGDGGREGESKKGCVPLERWTDGGEVCTGGEVNRWMQRVYRCKDGRREVQEDVLPSIGRWDGAPLRACASKCCEWGEHLRAQAQGNAVSGGRRRGRADVQLCVNSSACNPGDSVPCLPDCSLR